MRLWPPDLARFLAGLREGNVCAGGMLVVADRVVAKGSWSRGLEGSRVLLLYACKPLCKEQILHAPRFTI
jgi:hypothetical protein